MSELFSGAIAMGSAVIALFFLRFWRTTGDRFFLYFASSFMVEAAHRIYAAMATHDAREEDPLHYAIRLLAYMLILWAVLEKNWPRRPRNRAE